MKTIDLLIGKLRARVKEQNLKNTSQREVVMRAMFKHKGHYTPEEVLVFSQKEEGGKNLGIATVYRTLNFFEKEGFVVSISFGAEGKRYELNVKEHHDHMICDECDKIIEFESDEIEKLQELEAGKKGFSIKSHAMQLHGICKECQQKNKGNNG
jgi:Fur family ferric uptake transcriptional regulator